MNLLFLLLFGCLLFFCLYLFFFPEYLYANPTYIYHNGGINVPITKKTILFPFIVIVFLAFIVLASFQFIDISINAYWIRSNDLTRYKVLFDNAIDYELVNYFTYCLQEPIYVLLIWLLRRITPHFSIVLVLFFTFISIQTFNFLKQFIKKKYFLFSLIAFISLYYSTILISFCLLRLGLAIACSLTVYNYLSKNKLIRAFLFSLCACGFHYSSVYLIIVTLLYYFYNIMGNRFFFIFYLFSIICIIFISKLIPLIFGTFTRYLVYNESSIAKNNLIINTLLLIFIIYKKKAFFNMNYNKVFYIVLLSNFYIFCLQIYSSIFYRLIFFSYPVMLFICIDLFKIYRLEKKGWLISLGVRFILLIYLFVFLYKFITEAWFSYGLHEFKLFYFY